MDLKVMFSSGHNIYTIEIFFFFQLVNLMCGISGHGGKYACSYCEGESDLTCGKMRTIGSLNGRYRKFLDIGSKTRR